MDVQINITPMSLQNGVLGLPICCCREWDATYSVNGTFVYNGIASPITFSPKHIKYILSDQTLPARAGAWQFTVNNSLQFSQLKQDGVYTYAEGRTCGEKLLCTLELKDGAYVLTVKDKQLKPLTNATRKLQELLQQGIRPESSDHSSAPQWNSPSGWIDFKHIRDYQMVTDCLYMWYGQKEDSKTTYLYVGIVGDTRSRGQSKRTLCQRLTEENKQWLSSAGIHICKFRYCSLNHAHGFPVPELLKTVEMAEITVMTSLFSCENARDGIEPLFADMDIVLLNKMTSFKYIK